MKLLFTGFAPFGGDAANPSYDCLRALPPVVGDRELVTMELPVSFRRAPAMLLEKLREEQPDGVICFGLAAGRKCLTPERVALNLAHARIPDNDGDAPQDTILDPHGPAAWFSTFRAQSLVRALNEAGFPAELSCHAGTYVCNCVMYHLLAWATPRGVPAGFVHVPATAGFPLERLTEAVEFLARELSLRPRP